VLDDGQLVHGEERERVANWLIQFSASSKPNGSAKIFFGSL
jgi:hypothetical protein